VVLVLSIEVALAEELALIIALPVAVDMAVW